MALHVRWLRTLLRVCITRIALLRDFCFVCFKPSHQAHRAGDLPIEQSKKFELVVNLQTAKALGLAIPEPILLRDDEVFRKRPVEALESRIERARRTSASERISLGR